MFYLCISNLVSYRFIYTFKVEKCPLVLYLKKKLSNTVDYKKKALSRISTNESYEEIDTRLASGWYVDPVGSSKKKKYKTKKVSYTISKKQKD